MKKDIVAMVHAVLCLVGMVVSIATGRSEIVSTLFVLGGLYFAYKMWGK